MAVPVLLFVADKFGVAQEEQEEEVVPVTESGFIIIFWLGQLRRT